ncbi:uncharacterized protein LOC120704260 [Panicum virgatum]|uniref:uncharacterized protein LOC120704260 n=1 Tax=Panicum virgatum TaxID=38727 RepID=UPI0019D68B08|nr:uncharacterized protein LOC120704260 [Panicum virgatum]
MEEEKVWTASLHLNGVAAEWYFQLERDVGVLSWARFVEYINLRFGPPIRSSSLGELTNLRRSGSVEEYQRCFLALLCRCTDLIMQHQIDLFTAGLGQPLSSDDGHEPGARIRASGPRGGRGWSRSHAGPDADAIWPGPPRSGASRARGRDQARRTTASAVPTPLAGGDR